MTITIKKNLVNKDKYNVKCPHPMTAEFIVVHNTANDASAANEISYMITNDKQVSFHVAVDDKEAIQGIPFERNAWACGDGANGKGNRKGIQIEICYSKSGGDKFTKAEQNASKLIAQLLKDRGWDVSKVKKHQDFSNKKCPHRTLDLGWERFVSMIQAELNALSQPTTEDRETYYRVVVASYKDKTNAEQMVQELKAKGYKDAFLVAFKK